MNILALGETSEDDLRFLDSYRRSFSDAYENVVGQIRDQLKLEPTGRPAKSTTSIIDKLQRENIRLSQMQDIAGCRVVVLDLLSQNEALDRLTELFDRAAIVDRREQPEGPPEVVITGRDTVQRPVGRAGGLLCR